MPLKRACKQLHIYATLVGWCKQQRTPKVHFFSYSLLFLILGKFLTVIFLQEQNKESSHQHELQNERTTTLERTIAENRTQAASLHAKLNKTKQTLSSKLEQTTQSMVVIKKDNIQMVLYLLLATFLGFLIGKIL